MKSSPSIDIPWTIPYGLSGSRSSQLLSCFITLLSSPIGSFGSQFPSSSSSMSSSSWFSPSLTGMIWNKAGLHTCPGMFDQVIQRSNTRATQEICSPGVRWSTHQRGNQNPSTEIHYQPRLIIQDHNNGGSMESTRD
ncbi:hypothetical protein DY000_02021272 [Brassica cretica]|uniref:Uncharacterized protein n=1 Tax=Brassica cretica TaxID=69181 RepID=A0ABQ7ECG6_BRACR|nr:hypothetical protein DY000_02021272 [Brassica cretica]